jgi:hypothetical protein
MQRFIKILTLYGISAIFMTVARSMAATLQIPPCPEGTEREFIPNASKPVWASCIDSGGLYQGILIQFSTQTEVIRIAGIKDSLREGREIRFGASGTIEERSYKDGHLEGPSFIFQSNATLGRYIPKEATAKDWQNFLQPPTDSILKPWIGGEPTSRLQFSGGRLTRVQFDGKDYSFRVTKEGRMYSMNHSEMKGLFFFDPEALWDLNAADTKSLLKYGFGSCKKYDGPLGRYGRHYDVLLFRRELVEKKHLSRLKEMRDRLIQFCVPEDIQRHLGTLECPPLLPGPFPQHHCLLSMSDQMHIPYDPKYFQFEFTMGHPPEVIHALMKKSGLMKFASKPDATEDVIKLSEQNFIAVKKTTSGIVFKLLEKDKNGKIKATKANGDNDKSWWDWKHLPGF